MDLNSKGLHPRGSSKLAKNLLDFKYLCCGTGSSVPPESGMNDNRINKTLSDMRAYYSQCVSLRYIDVNAIRNKFCNIPFLTGNNLDIFAIAKTKLDSSFAESQFLLEGMKKPCRLGVTSKKGELLVFVNKDIPSKYLRDFYLPRDIHAILIEINLK